MSSQSWSSFHQHYHSDDFHYSADNNRKIKKSAGNRKDLLQSEDGTFKKKFSLLPKSLTLAADGCLRSYLPGNMSPLEKSANRLVRGDISKSKLECSDSSFSSLSGAESSSNSRGSSSASRRRREIKKRQQKKLKKQASSSPSKKKVVVSECPPVPQNLEYENTSKNDVSSNSSLNDSFSTLDSSCSPDHIIAAAATRRSSLDHSLTRPASVHRVASRRSSLDVNATTRRSSLDYGHQELYSRRPSRGNMPPTRRSSMGNMPFIRYGYNINDNTPKFDEFDCVYTNPGRRYRTTDI